MNKEIPISEAEAIAKKYKYEQIVILAQKQNDKKDNWFDGWATTFNTDKTKCKFLGKIAAILIYNLRAFYPNKKTTEEYYKKVNNQMPCEGCKTARGINSRRER